MTRPLIFLLLFLLFCLPACAKQAGLGTNSNPFAATGLLAHPDETAEEILIRAHHQDGDAVVLTVVGYALGVGGFPQDSFLAFKFNNEYMPSGWEYSYQFLDLVNRFTYYSTYDSPGQPTPEECLAASRSHVAPIFRQAGIFDLDSVCADVGYAANLDDYKPKGFYSYENAFHPEWVDRPMSKQETEYVELELEIKNPDFMSYLRGSLTNGSKMPAQQVQKLLRFMDLRMAEGVANNPHMRDFTSDLIMDVSASEVNAELAREIIRKAHQGDAFAAWQMAENYRTGALGFPQNNSLTAGWLERAAFRGHRKALDNYTIYNIFII